MTHNYKIIQRLRSTKKASRLVLIYTKNKLTVYVDNEITYERDLFYADFLHLCNYFDNYLSPLNISLETALTFFLIFDRYGIYRLTNNVN